MNRKFVILFGIVLVVLVVAALFFAANFLGSRASLREFYVGVEYAYGDHGNDVAEVKLLVDKVKDYTNLFIIGLSGLTFNKTALDEASDYVVAADLNLIVQFTSLYRYDYNTSVWLAEASMKYGDKFLGVYRYDEPGGNQLDDETRLINNTVIAPSWGYSQIAEVYVGNLSVFPDYYLNFAPRIFTADYALYWFDYKAKYTTIFAEFVGNESRERHIALCRGAARAFDKDWGVIVTWKYEQEPYLESGEELYADLALAYSAGAKYAIVFSYPHVTDYGTLTDDHFDALERFWNTMHTNPESFGSRHPEVAYIVPKDYGFGFRSPTDNIWGFFPADELSPKIYNDVVTLTAKFDSKLDIFYDEPEYIEALLGNYSKVYYWNQTIT
ncbi:MAG: hypothetical protein NWE95_05245 [Candidatus Bathyarchaeota archaeon]|nr:hypothetical protein [Candidatus Bathyarchaeota archaeon]